MVQVSKKIISEYKSIIVVDAKKNDVTLSHIVAAIKNYISSDPVSFLSSYDTKIEVEINPALKVGEGVFWRMVVRDRGCGLACCVDYLRFLIDMTNQHIKTIEPYANIGFSDDFHYIGAYTLYACFELINEELNQDVNSDELLGVLNDYLDIVDNSHDTEIFRRFLDNYLYIIGKSAPPELLCKIIAKKIILSDGYQPDSKMLERVFYSHSKTPMLKQIVDLILDPSINHNYNYFSEELFYLISTVYGTSGPRERVIEYINDNLPNENKIKSLEYPQHILPYAIRADAKHKALQGNDVEHLTGFNKLLLKNLLWED